MAEVSLTAHPRPVPAHGVSFGEAWLVWLRVAALSFGGPAGQIAVMHRIIVDEKKWVGEARFLHALSYCMLLPGPEAQQLATYIGWMLHRTPGAIAAGTLFVLPGFVAILALSIADPRPDRGDGVRRAVLLRRLVSDRDRERRARRPARRPARAERHPTRSR